MKFYFRGVIWDGANSKALCESENGEFETNDEYIISELTRLGYPNEGKKEEVNKGVKAINIKTSEPVPLRKEEKPVAIEKEIPKGKKKK